MPDEYSPADSAFACNPNNGSGFIKQLVLQVRKVIGPFAAPKKAYINLDARDQSGGEEKSVIYKVLPVRPTQALSWTY